MSDYSIEVDSVLVEEAVEDGIDTVHDYFLTCTNSVGQVFVHFKSFGKDVESAHSFCDMVRRTVERMDCWTVEDNENWRFVRNAYGSQSWSKSDEHELQKLDVENEFGVESYQPGNVGYLK